MEEHPMSKASDAIRAAGIARLVRELDLTEEEAADLPEAVIKRAGIRELRQREHDGDDERDPIKSDSVIDSLGDWEYPPIGHEAPSINEVTPSRGPEGSTITITGPDIGRERRLTVDGEPARYQFRSPNLVRLQLPEVQGEAYTVRWADRPFPDEAPEFHSIDIRELGLPSSSAERRDT
jgi:hypothetical protein